MALHRFLAAHSPPFQGFFLLGIPTLVQQQAV
jgi:hypothetical protein